MSKDDARKMTIIEELLSGRLAVKGTADCVKTPRLLSKMLKSGGSSLVLAYFYKFTNEIISILTTKWGKQKQQKTFHTFCRPLVSLFSP